VSGDLSSDIVAVLIVVGISFGIFALFPRKMGKLVLAWAVALCVLLFFTALGSALIAPNLDVTPMLLWTPLSLTCAVVWYLWKVKPRETSSGRA
jgi:hypothetical protein